MYNLGADKLHGRWQNQCEKGYILPPILLAQPGRTQSWASES